MNSQPSATAAPVVEYEYDRDIAFGLDEAQLALHWDSLYGGLTIDGGGAIAVVYEAPNADDATKPPWRRHQWIHVARGRDAEDRATFIAAVKSAVKRYSKVGVILNPRFNEAITRPKAMGTASNDLLACVVVTRVDVDTIDGVHSEKNLPTRGQLPAIMNAVPCGRPTIVMATGGGEHWDYQHNPVLTPEEGKEFGDRLAWHFKELTATVGVKVSDPGVTTRTTLDSRFAGTIHGKDDERRERTIQIISHHPGRVKSFTRIDRLPKSSADRREEDRQQRIAAAARRATARPARTLGSIVPGDNFAAASAFSAAVPADTILEEIMGFEPLPNDGDEGSAVKWKWFDNHKQEASIETFTHDVVDGETGEVSEQRRFIIYGESTADQFGLETGRVYSSWALLKVISGGSPSMAGSQVRLAMVIGMESILDWAQNAWSLEEARPRTLAESMSER